MKKREVTDLYLVWRTVANRLIIEYCSLATFENCTFSSRSGVRWASTTDVRWGHAISSENGLEHKYLATINTILHQSNAAAFYSSLVQRRRTIYNECTKKIPLGPVLCSHHLPYQNWVFWTVYETILDMNETLDWYFVVWRQISVLKLCYVF